MHGSEVARISMRKIIGLLLLAAWVIFVVVYVVKMIRDGEKEADVIVTSHFIDIQSSHGARIPLNAITEIELKENMPQVGRRVRGYNSFTCVKKGEFELEGMGVNKIYIFSNEGPYLHIYAEGQVVIIAFEDPGKTRRLYEQIVMQRDRG